MYSVIRFGDAARREDQQQRIRALVEQAWPNCGDLIVSRREPDLTASLLESEDWHSQSVEIEKAARALSAITPLLSQEGVTIQFDIAIYEDDYRTRFLTEFGLFPDLLSLLGNHQMSICFSIYNDIRDDL
jgi:hypothetical protein